MKTQRIELRPFRMSDLQDTYEYCSQEGVGEMAGWPHHQDIATTQQALEQFIASGRMFAVVLKEGGKVIGHVSVNDDSEEGRTDTRELGFVLNRDYQRQGLMTEAVMQMLERLKQQGIRYVWACCFQDNLSSRKLIEKCGFSFMQEGSYKAERLHKTLATYEYRLTLF